MSTQNAPRPSRLVRLTDLYDRVVLLRNHALSGSISEQTPTRWSRVHALDNRLDVIGNAIGREVVEENARIAAEREERAEARVESIGPRAREIVRQLSAHIGGPIDQTIYANEGSSSAVVWRNDEVLELLRDIRSRAV